MDGAVQVYRRQENGIWYARFSVKGRQLKKSLKTEDLTKAKKEARQKYLEAMGRAQAGRPITDVPFSQVSASFMDYYEELVERGEKLPEDLKYNVEGKIRRFFDPYFGKMGIAEITTRDIDKFQDWRRRYWTRGPGSKEVVVTYDRGTKKGITRTIEHGAPKKSTLNRELGVLRLIFKHAEKEGWIASGEIPAVRYVKGKTDRRPSFEPYEVQTLINYLDDQVLEIGLSAQERRKRILFRAFIHIAYTTGMRPVEMKNLRWRDIVGIKGRSTYEFKELKDWPIEEHDVRIYVRGKGKARRLVPLKPVVPILSTLYDLWEDEQGKPPKPNDPVLFNRDGTPKNRPQKKLRDTLRALDLLHDHDDKARTFLSFRHFYASELLMGGNTVHDVAANMGTSVQMIEKHYGHINLERNAEKLQLGR